jgi:hypothetical protein
MLGFAFTIIFEIISSSILFSALDFTTEEYKIILIIGFIITLLVLLSFIHSAKEIMKDLNLLNERNRL